MINERELRIGNYISDIHASDSFFAKVSAIDNYKCFYGSFACKHQELKPIPLTEEWLVRFGFEWEGINLYELNGFYVLVKGNEFRFTPYGCLLDTNPDFESFNKIEFVHELQNIYYWNNNKTELELK